MLIRLCGHFIDNPGHRDKLIAIKGLPEEWILRPSRFGGKELVKPWIPDIEANIPKSIRNLCEPIEITVVFPPIHKDADYVVDHLTIIGIRFDYMTEPGHELWEKIEDYIERMTPRDQRILKPCIVAPDQKSEFNPHMAKRSVRGGLEFHPCDIPVIDLRPTAPTPINNDPKVAVVMAPIILPPQTVPATQTTTTMGVNQILPTVSTTVDKTIPENLHLNEKIQESMTQSTETFFNCDQCSKSFSNKRALHMHKVGGHKKVAPATVGV
ncbi:MAG TPA: hypothetical protein VF974_08255 [Patescibacteria group bacterium]